MCLLKSYYWDQIIVVDKKYYVSLWSVEACSITSMSQLYLSKYTFTPLMCTHDTHHYIHYVYRWQVMFPAGLLSVLLQKPSGMVFVFWSIPQQVRNGESWQPWYMTNPTTEKAHDHLQWKASESDTPPLRSSGLFQDPEKGSIQLYKYITTPLF